MRAQQTSATWSREMCWGFKQITMGMGQNLTIFWGDEHQQQLWQDTGGPFFFLPKVPDIEIVCSGRLATI